MRVAAIAYPTVHEALRRAIPEFGDAVDEHVADNDEVLPHVSFGDLTRFVLAAHHDGDRELVSRSLAFLERALREGDNGLQNLVAVSFVENVGPWDKSQERFIESWPEALRLEARRQREWTPGDT